MLLNQQGQQVRISDKLNSKSHPHVFASLHEVKDPLPTKDDKMFSLETRAHIKNA